MHQPIPFDAILVVTAVPLRASARVRSIRTRLARRLLAGRQPAPFPRPLRPRAS